MSEFNTHLYSGRAYTSEEIISFSQSPTTHFSDIDKEMQFHKEAKHVQVSCLTQDEFDFFVTKYADNFDSIYFFQNPKVKDLSALASLRQVKYLLFYNFRTAKKLWDMSQNTSLQGIFISSSKNLVYDISSVADAPSLEELLLFSNLDRKYIVQSLDPILKSKSVRRVMLDCKTEDGNFDPGRFSNLEVFLYRVDGKSNFRY